MINTPYVTKDHLQLKRFQAQKHDTTYVYDLPEMFRQVPDLDNVPCSVCTVTIRVTFIFRETWQFWRSHGKHGKSTLTSEISILIRRNAWTHGDIVTHVKKINITTVFGNLRATGHQPDIDAFKSLPSTDYNFSLSVMY